VSQVLTIPTGKSILIVDERFQASKVMYAAKNAGYKITNNPRDLTLHTVLVSVLANVASTQSFRHFVLTFRTTVNFADLLPGLSKWNYTPTGGDEASGRSVPAVWLP
jgi:uncharacterized MAPEG superfamily protein